MTIFWRFRYLKKSSSPSDNSKFLYGSKCTRPRDRSLIYCSIEIFENIFHYLPPSQDRTDSKNEIAMWLCRSLCKHKPVELYLVFFTCILTKMTQHTFCTIFWNFILRMRASLLTQIFRNAEQSVSVSHTALVIHTKETHKITENIFRRWFLLFVLYQSFGLWSM